MCTISVSDCISGTGSCEVGIMVGGDYDVITERWLKVSFKSVRISEKSVFMR